MRSAKGLEASVIGADLQAGKRDAEQAEDQRYHHRARPAWPERIRELIAMGASFDHGVDGNLHLKREGGHSHRRIVHAADMTRREIERALLEVVDKDPNIFVFEQHFAIDLLTLQNGSDIVCVGIDALNTETLEVTPK